MPERSDESLKLIFIKIYFIILSIIYFSWFMGFFPNIFGSSIKAINVKTEEPKTSRNVEL